ncbi:MAG: agmatine deiminase family protein [Phycisphaerales bacterium]
MTTLQRVHSFARLVALTALAGTAASANAGANAARTNAEPIVTDAGLVYPEGAAIPRYLTNTEREWIARNPLGQNPDRAVTAPPVGPIQCVAEYEPMDGIFLSWAGPGSWLTIVCQMAAGITTTGNAIAYVGVTSATLASAQANIQAFGANMSKVVFVDVVRDSIWIRDYGPRYCYEGNVRVVTDHEYNRPRPNDNLTPDAFAAFKGHKLYSIGIGAQQLVHGGGNFHLDANNRAWATQLINNENPFFTQGQITGLWNTYQALNVTITQPFPASVDATQHIDMWMQILGDNKVMISDWPLQPGSTQDQICDSTAVSMASQGFTVTRVPAFSVSGVHYTFTNVVICNNLLLLPTYTNTTVVNNNGNTDALTSWTSALGAGYTIQQVPCQAIVTAAGVMHCIAMHVPKHLGTPGTNGGLAPTAYLQTLRGGQVLNPGSNQSISWVSDDDNLVSSVSIQLSLDGGNTWPTTIASGQPRNGSFNWVVPNLCDTQARIRVVAVDAQGNTGADASTANMTLNAPLPGDIDSDKIVNINDLVILLGNFATGVTPNTSGDFNGDGLVNVNDLTFILGVFGTAC